MTFDELTPELREKAKECKTPEELVALAREEGITLSDKELSQISGGAGWNNCNYSPCSDFSLG